MDKVEIIKGNILIAKFMGWTSEGVLNGEHFYHYKWDWLMPVVEKIEAIKTEKGFQKYDVEIGSTQCAIYDMSNHLKVVTVHDQETKIMATYSSIIAFINFYNSQNKQDNE